MAKMRLIPWVGLAMSAALVAGCVAAPAVIRTSLPNVVGESYADNANPPEFVKAIPVGEEVVIPRGKAAMTLFVVIPQKQAASEGDRKAQYIEFSNIRRVDVMITGENLVNPVTTSINVSSGTSAAGTVVLNAGRNQVITAVGKDAAGNVISTVRGVATSVAGQVVNAEAKFGTTPLAEVISALPATVSPEINLAAINGVINPIIGTAPNYSTHPTFINSLPIVNAIKTLLASGTLPNAITTGMITDQLGGAQPVYMAGAVRLSFLDSHGQTITSAVPNAKFSYPYDRNGDGVLDGGAYSGSSADWACTGMYVTDPVSARQYWSSLPVTVSNIPPGTFQLGYSNNLGGATTRPWEVFPSKAFNDVATVSVQPGAITNLSYQLQDVSKPVAVSSGGTFSSVAPTYDTRNGYWNRDSHEWHRFSSQANLVYSIDFAVDPFIVSQNGGMSSVYLRVFDVSGTQLYQGEAASGSFTFASAATNSLYVYTPFASTSVNVTTQTLGQNQSLYNATIRYGE